MIHNCQRKTITAVQIGPLETSEVEQALYRANELQHPFFFHSDFYNGRLPMPDSYKLSNGSYDICGAVKNVLLNNRQYKHLPRPLLVFSSAQLGDPDHPNDPDYVYFCSQEDDYDANVTIISTADATDVPESSIESYVFMMLGTHILSVYANISYHSPRGCFLDYFDEWTEAQNSLKAGALCDECAVEIQKRIRRNQVSVEVVAAAVRLLNKAAHKKYCFVVMPFADKLARVYRVVRDALIEKGWNVKRADEIAFPRLITSRIYHEILCGDLVVGDLTDSNPNVFYEIGLTHAVGNDLLLLTQQDDIPFDLKNEHTIFYSLAKLDELKEAVQRFAGSAY